MGATDGDAVVDGYTTLRTLGKGASGTVVLARHDASGSLLVVKQLAPELVAAHGFLERFREQAEILGQLRHPNIVSVYWHVERRAEALVAMEAVNGISLRRLLDHGPTDPESALVVLQGALRGLQYAHGAGAVHGDIAPENVLLDSAGDPRLVDFGLAVPVAGDALAAGRPQYMAPEQWQTGRATRQSDIYAAAAVCFECVAGEPPFTGATLTELRQLHLAAWVPVEQLPEPLRGLIAKGLAKDPVVRFPTAGAFLAELEVVAAATYGADWADRGQRALSRAVEALATQLPPAGLAGDATAAGAGSAIAVTVDGGEKAERPRRRVAFGSGRFGPPVVGALILLLAGGVLAAALITHFGSSSTPSGVAGGPRSTASPSPAASSTSTSTSSTTTASTSTSSTSTSSTTTVTTSTGARSSSSTSSSVLPVAAAPPVTTPPTGTSSGSLPPPVANGVISGSVINDANGNGVADPGEVGIPGVLVTLAPVGGPAHAAAQTRGAASGARQRDASRVDAAINDLNAGLSGGSATTDGAGTFSFTGLVAGTYSLGYTPPSGFVDTATVQHTIVLTAGQILNGQTFLAQQRNASIGGAVINDANGNGVLDAAEKGLPGAVVTLAKGTVPVATATTDASGAYLFNVLPAGNYTLSDRLPPGFVTTGLQPAPMALLAGGTLTGQNLFAQQRTASISGGVVSKDTKAGIPGVAISLFKGTTALATTTTKSSGHYVFGSLAQGTYRITFSPPPGSRNAGQTSLTVTVRAGQATTTKNFFAQRKRHFHVGAR